MRYLDTGSRDPDDSLFRWLEGVLPDARYFGCQTGYFSYDGIYPLQSSFEALLERHGTLHLVVGGNESGVRRQDLERVLDLFDAAPPQATTSLTVVAADDALMHPKAFYVEKLDGTRHAFVGSANLTNPGLSRNIEAALVIDSTTDPLAPFTGIREAIDRWHEQQHPNAYSVTRSSLAKLVSAGILDIPRIHAPVSPANHRQRSKIFPALGALIQLPRRRRSLVPRTKTAPTIAINPAPIGTLGSLPNGAVGILKSLSSLDVKAFHGGVGTSYIALPVDIGRFLPMKPYGKNAEPRIDVTAEARLEGAPEEVVVSGETPTNITHVGLGATRTSHEDLRFNYLTGIRKGIERAAAEHHLSVPGEDDLAAIEFLEGVHIRLTFITGPASIANLRPLLNQKGATWGWLQPGVVGPWDVEVDA